MQRSSASGYASGSGYSGFVPSWKRDTLPEKIGSRVPVSERVRLRKKASAGPSVDAGEVNVDHLGHEYQLHRRKTDSVYTKSFPRQAGGLCPPRAQGLLSKAYGDLGTATKVDSSETFKTTHSEAFAPPEMQGTRGKSLSERAEKFSVNRVKLVPQETPDSSYGSDITKTTFSSLASTTEVSSTLDLQAGTAKGTGFPSSFMGHIPMTHKNRKRMFDSKDDPRKLHSKDAYYTKLGMDIPGYTGHVPQALSNRRLEPTKADKRTTKNYHHDEKTVDPHVSKKFGISSSTAREFFEMPDAGSSDGVAAAAKFYSVCRPYEGYMKGT